MYYASPFYFEFCFSCNACLLRLMHAMPHLCFKRIGVLSAVINNIGLWSINTAIILFLFSAQGKF
jgi:hypothetical protein